MIDPYLGEIMWFAGNFAPRDWEKCEGQILAINQHTALYALIGTTYGGDGKATFALPDLRDRMPEGPIRTEGEQPGTSFDAMDVVNMPPQDDVLSTATLGLTACIALYGNFPPRG